MEMPVWLKCGILVVILIAQTGWILNCLKKISQAIGLYKSDEQLARIYLEKERLRAQQAYSFSSPTTYLNAQQEQPREDAMPKSKRDEWRDVSPEPRRLTSALKLLPQRK